MPPAAPPLGLPPARLRHPRLNPPRPHPPRVGSAVGCLPDAPVPVPAVGGLPCALAPQPPLLHRAGAPWARSTAQRRHRPDPILRPAAPLHSTASRELCRWAPRRRTSSRRWGWMGINWRRSAKKRRIWRGGQQDHEPFR